MCLCTCMYTCTCIFVHVYNVLVGETSVHSQECVVCLNKNYTNKRTKFKITAALQRDTQQVRPGIQELVLYSLLRTIQTCTCTCIHACTLYVQYIIHVQMYIVHVHVHVYMYMYIQCTYTCTYMYCTCIFT